MHKKMAKYGSERRSNIYLNASYIQEKTEKRNELKEKIREMVVDEEAAVFKGLTYWYNMYKQVMYVCLFVQLYSYAYLDTESIRGCM